MKSSHLVIETERRKNKKKKKIKERWMCFIIGLEVGIGFTLILLQMIK